MESHNKAVISGVKEGVEVGKDGWVGESDVGTLEVGITTVPDGNLTLAEEGGNSDYVPGCTAAERST